MSLRKILFLVFLPHLLSGDFVIAKAGDDIAKRQAYLEQLLPFFGSSRAERGKFSPVDLTWQDWQKRTGELPPDFDKMPGITTLPDPLILDEGGKNIPVETLSQWREKRKWISRQTQHWVTGTIPPPPDNMISKIVSERKEGDITLQMVEVRFGPDHKAKIGFELIIPPGKGPFPVFLAQWSQRTWSLVAVRRGYIACLYRGSDFYDDTDEYGDIYYPEYDFNRLMRRGWGGSRAIDYLYTLPIVDKKCIGLTGHSRNGKQSLMAAAFDERITAVIPCSGNTASENAFRYTTENFNNETVETTIRARPNWLSPRLRFFVGRMHKLPVDMNLMMAMVAPRGLMLSSATAEGAGNPWGIEQTYFSAKRVYDFLGAGDKIALHLRPGLHGISSGVIEEYVDFFDYVFGRTDKKPENKLFFDYTFNKWLGLSGEIVDPMSYEPKGIDDLLVDCEGKKITTATAWKQKKADIKKRIRWGLGDEPAGAVNPGPMLYTNVPWTEHDYFGQLIGRPTTTKNMARMAVAAHYGMGEVIYGNLYYPTDDTGKPISMNLPVVIYLHEYAYGTGSGKRFISRVRGVIEKGYAVLVYDHLGTGSRLDEGTRFYQRYPNWSKLGKMVADLKAAVDTMENMDIIDKDRIYVMGYALGARVALYGAALDERIKGVVSVCGFTPMRLNGKEKGLGGIYIYSHLHGLAPRLGFFVDYEDRIPYDYHEIIAAIAPRPVLIVAPTWDRYADFEDVKNCVGKSLDVYKLLDKSQNLDFFAPEEHNMFSGKTRNKIWDWIPKNFK